MAYQTQSTEVARLLHLHPPDALEALVLHYLVKTTLAAVPENNIAEDATISFLITHGSTLWPAEIEQRGHLSDDLSQDTVIGKWYNLILQFDERPVYIAHGAMRIGERVEFRHKHGHQPDPRQEVLGGAIAKIIVPYAESLRKEKDMMLKSDEQVQQLVDTLLSTEDVTSLLTTNFPTMDSPSLLEFVNMYDATTATVDTTTGFFEYPNTTTAPTLPLLESTNMYDAATPPFVTTAPPPLEYMNMYEATTPPAVISNQPTAQKPRYVCPACSRSFAKKHSLKKHKSSHREYSSRSLEQHPCPVKDCEYLYTHDDIKEFHVHLSKTHGLSIGLGGGKALLYKGDGVVVGEMATDGSSISITEGGNGHTLAHDNDVQPPPLQPLVPEESHGYISTSNLQSMSNPFEMEQTWQTAHNGAEVLRLALLDEAQGAAAASNMQNAIVSDGDGTDVLYESVEGMDGIEEVRHFEQRER